MAQIEAERYTDSLYAEDEFLECVEKSIRMNAMPEISVPPGYGRLLTMLVKMSGAKRILEIGALGGYSGICLCRGLEAGGKLISLELHEAFAEVAHTNLKAAGWGDQVEYRVGQALENLEILASEGQKFDFFFIDADKANYPHYLQWAIELANPGAIIVADNVLLRGRSADPDVQLNSTLKMREFNMRIASDPMLDSTILTAYDGLAIARVKHHESG